MLKESIIRFDFNLTKGDKVKDLILKKITANSFCLDMIAKSLSGLKSYQTGKGLPPQTNDIKNNRIYHSREKKNETYYPYLEGVDIKRYKKVWSGEYLSFGDHLAEPRKSVFLSAHFRLAVRQIPSKPPYCINCAPVDNDDLHDINSHAILCDSEIVRQFVMAFVNSRLTSFWFFYKFNKLSRGLFPQFKVKELKMFPIPKNILKEDKEKLSSLANTMTDLLKQSPKTEQEKRLHRQKEDLLNKQIDQLVYQIYGLTPDEIALVEAFGKEKP
jgi:hypothetical protein